MKYDADGAARNVDEGVRVRAVQLERFGGPDVLRLTELPDPVPTPDQVLIDVDYASITFVETQVRAGRPPNPAMLPPLPAVLGNGVGGTVLGPSTSPHVGRRVIASLNGRGGYAERAVAAIEHLTPAPDDVPLEVATALLADGRTALGLLGTVGEVSGLTVLITAAAGGVGGLLVQLVTAAGGTVLATAGGHRKVAHAVSLGAAVGIDYTQPDWPLRVRERVGALDVVLDGVGGDVTPAALELLRGGGTLCAFGAASGRLGVAPADVDRPDVRVVTMSRPSPSEQVELQRAALERAAAGELRTTVGRVVPLADASAAHAAIEARATIGKTLLHTR